MDVIGLGCVPGIVLCRVTGAGRIGFDDSDSRSSQPQASYMHFNLSSQPQASDCWYLKASGMGIMCCYALIGLYAYYL